MHDSLLRAALLALAATLTACRTGGSGEPGSSGIELADLDTSCDPCDDFYQYATGGWREAHPIPDEHSVYGVTDELREQNEAVLRDALEELAAAGAAAESEDERKLGDLYCSCMDEQRIESAGVAPLAYELRRIAAIESVDDVRSVVALLHGIGLEPLFAFGSEGDLDDSDQVIAWAFQGGLGLPDRDYYTRTDPASRELLDDYRAHVGRMLALVHGAEEPGRQADRVLAIESRLAVASMTRARLRDPRALHNPTTVADLDASMPHFDFAAYCAELGLADLERLNVGQPEFFRAVDRLLADTEPESWRAYLRWHLVHGFAAALSSDFVEEDFRFYGRVLAGSQELRPRWRRCLGAVQEGMGEALGRVFVEREFSPVAKARANELVDHLVAALRDRIEGLDWMGPDTKAQALLKLDRVGRKLGYPDVWRDYSTLVVDRGPFARNLASTRAFEFRRQLGKIGRPVDPDEWGMAPSEINAYYHPLRNEVVFPAGILQPPFFDEHADDPVNYGAIGAVIGHELVHGFDDQGSRFDADGNLRDWWTAADRAAFEERAAVVAAQFDAYRVDGDLPVRGDVTLGENLADLGGLAVAHDALQRAFAAHGRPPAVDGFTPEQRFFLSYAQCWRRNARPEALRLQVETDAHAPARFRVLGPLSNLPEFREAFDCEEGDAMVRAVGERAEVW